MEIKRRVHEILDVAALGDRLSRICDLFIVSLIALNVIALIAESVQEVHDAAPEFFRYFEFISVLIFTVEYALRVWSCTVVKRFRSPIKGRIRFLFTPLAMVDLIAILPFYLPFVGLDLRFMRSARLMRIFRIAKVGRYSKAVQMLGRVLRAKKEELLVTVFTLLILLVIASSLVYYAERDAQPTAFASIPASMWWGIATLTTVGYGDVYPVTPLGKLLASVMAVFGIGLFALPAGILAAGFREEFERRRNPVVCPHCGKRITA